MICAEATEEEERIGEYRNPHALDAPAARHYREALGSGLEIEHGTQGHLHGRDLSGPG